jgi:AcrR family transcriptional regulator
VTRPPKPLTRDRILAAALDILDREGLEALSMRRIGEAVGVEAMSLYNHVPNKSALLDGIQEVMLGLVERAPKGVDWRGLARHQARSLHHVLRKHPNAIALFARPAGTTAVFARLEDYLGVLIAAGFAPLEALNVVQIVMAFVVGHALFAASAHEGGALPSGKNVEAVARELGTYDADEELELGLDALLRGLSPKGKKR